MLTFSARVQALALILSCIYFGDNNTNVTMSEEASSSMGAPARTSGRNKVKSQRVIEMEDTARMVAAAKAKQKAEQEAEARGDVKPSNKTGSDVSKAKNSKTKGKGKGKAKKVDLYCVCKKPSDEDDGPMIECAECNDW